MSGLTFSVGQLHQNYAEHPAPGSGTPDPADTQTGNITSYGVGMDNMGGHVGLSWDMNYSKGNTSYNGYLNNPPTFTPLTMPTKAKIFDGMLYSKVGFSPDPHIAIVPDVFYGFHYWDRNNSGSPHGYDEKYFNTVSGFGVTLAGQPDLSLPIVIQVNYQRGTTHNAKMTSAILPDTANLGSKPWTRYGAQMDYTPWSHITVFASYTHTKFQYGISQTFATGLYEPNSTTKQNIMQAGVKIHF